MPAKRPKRVEIRNTALLVLFALACASCGAGDTTDPDAPESPGTTIASDTPTTSPPTSQATDRTSTTPRPSSENEVVRAATADLADHLEIPEEEIDVVEVNHVDWPDASLGCPEEGRIYAQVITPGLEIILRAEVEDYHYHSGPEQEPILCLRPSDGKLIPPRGPVEIPDTED
jgi:hypothetical protein